LTYEKFMFVSALSGMALNNHHYIYSIKTYDLDQRVEKERYERQRKLDKGDQEQFVKAVSAFCRINRFRVKTCFTRRVTVR
jgi:hypothetical protein